MQQKLFDMPEPPSEGRSIAGVLADGCEQAAYGHTPIEEAQGTFHFIVCGFDGQQYAVTVANVADLVGDMRQ